MLTDAKYSLILNILFVYCTHLGLLFITYGTNYHTNSNMSIMDTKEVCLFSEVTGVEQALVQQIVSTVEEAYLADIHN